MGKNNKIIKKIANDEIIPNTCSDLNISSVGIYMSESMNTGFATLYYPDVVFDMLKNSYSRKNILEFNEVLFDSMPGFYLYIDYDEEVVGTRTFSEDKENEIFDKLFSKLDDTWKYHVAECCRPACGTKNAFKYSYRIVGDHWFTTKYEMLFYLISRGLGDMIDRSVYSKNRKIRTVYCKKSKPVDQPDDPYYDKPFIPITDYSRPVDFSVTALNKDIYTMKNGCFEFDMNSSYKDKEHHYDIKMNDDDIEFIKRLVSKSKAKISEINDEIKKKRQADEEFRKYIVNEKLAHPEKTEQDIINEYNGISNDGWTQEDLEYYDSYLSKLDISSFTDHNLRIKFIWSMLSKGRGCEKLIHKYASLDDKYTVARTNSEIAQFRPNKTGIYALNKYKRVDKTPTLMKPIRSKHTYQNYISNDYNIKHVNILSDSLDNKYDEIKNISDGKKFIGINSQTGTGKSKLMNKILLNYSSFVDICPRISLAQEHIRKINECGGVDLTYYKNVIGEIEAKKLIITPNSLHRIKKGIYFDCVYIDEIQSMIEHSIGETIDDYENLFKQIFDMISHAKCVIFGDAVFTDMVYEFIYDMCDRNTDNVIIFKNDFIRPRKNSARFVNSLKKILEMINLNVGKKKMLIFSDSKKMCRQIGEMVKKTNDSLDIRMYYDGVGSDNVNIFGYTKEQLFLKSRTGDIDICSPKLTYGVSIEDFGAYDEVFGVYTNRTTDAFSKMQQLSRYRHDVPIYIYSAPVGRTVVIGDKKIHKPFEPKYKTYDEVKKYYENIIEKIFNFTHSFETIYSRGKVEISSESLINKLKLLSLLYNERSKCEPQYCLIEQLKLKGFKFLENITDTIELNLIKGMMDKIKKIDAKIVDDIKKDFFDCTYEGKMSVEELIGGDLKSTDSCGEKKAYQDRLTHDNFDYICEIVKQHKAIMFCKLVSGIEIKKVSKIKNMPDFVSSVGKDIDILSSINEALGISWFDELNKLDHKKINYKALEKLDKNLNEENLHDVAKNILHIKNWKLSYLKNKNFEEQLFEVKKRYEIDILSRVKCVDVKITRSGRLYEFNDQYGFYDFFIAPYLKNSGVL